MHTEFLNSKRHDTIFTPFFTFLCLSSFAAENLPRVASYNVENYPDQPTESIITPKPTAGEAKIRESIKAMLLT